MKIGASQIDITPETPFPIQGHYYLRTGRKVLDPLYASCVVVDDGTSVLALISCDLACLEEDSVEQVRRSIQAETGIEKTNIFISATHTHQGPIMTDNASLLPWSVRDEIRYPKMIGGIIRSAVEAYGNRRPGRIGYGRGSAERCGFNRRYIMSDGRSMMNPFGVGNPDRLMVEGPVDPSVQVVWFEDLDGQYIAVMVNFADHPASLINTEFVSADFPGAMRADLHALYGASLPVLYIQGACGNIDTYDFEHDEQWGLGLDGYRRIGRILAGEVMKILSGGRAEASQEASVSSLTRFVCLPYKDIPQAEAEQTDRQWRRLSPEERDKLPFNEKVQATRVMHLLDLRNKSKTQLVGISVFRIGDLWFAVNPGEYFVEYQLALKKKYENRKMIVVELTNGSIGYIPTRQAIALGGYEAVSTHFDRDAGTMILNEWIEMIDRLMETDGIISFG